ncbi:MAG: DUF4147 domain-containing protein [Acidobacteria bacterium]|nr:MAG: DUF4147 domain-containing protein [Acidobacteriota bacterium]
MSSREARLRRHAQALWQAALAAVDPEGLVRADLAGREADDPSPDGMGGTSQGVQLVAAGKAAAGMVRGARAVLGRRLAGGVVIVPAGQAGEVPEGFAVYEGGHPVPDRGGVAGARAVAELAAGLGGEDRLLLLLSGGGSALMTLPPDGIALDDVVVTTDLLLRAGATIGELNAVRKHLDQLKGGRLARLARPARLDALVLSDVVGDPLEVIASGPASPDPTTFADAVAVLERRGLWDAVPAAVRSYLEAGRRGEVAESPKPGDPCFDGVEVRIVGSNRMAVAAAREAAEARGYRTLVLTTELSGEAREVGAVLAAIARQVRRYGEPAAPPACLLAAGETTVTVRGRGRGGRNQELALAAARGLAGVGGVLLASLGSDGIDGPTDAAGAVASGSTAARAAARGLDPDAALADNDAYPFFAALGDLIVTGPTGTNVMDLQLILVA